MATATLRKPALVGSARQGYYGKGTADTTAAKFKRNDLIAHLASGLWEKADADWDVAASGPLFAIALNSPAMDPYSVPLEDPFDSTDFGSRFGPAKADFDFAHLQGRQVEMNVDSGTDLTVALLGDFYGLVYDATTGIMTVDLSDTTNEVFFVQSIAPARIDPTVGKINVIGDSQVRVRGFFADAVCY